MDELRREQRERLAAYWWRRAEGEITSWVAFRHVLQDLRIEHSPASVLALAERAVADEYQHAVWCREWAEQFGHPTGVDLRPRSEQPLRFSGCSEAENRLLRIAFCCLTETVGCFLLRHVRPALRDPDLKKLNRRHLADELQHSRVGWAHLSTLGERQRDFLAEWMPKLLELLPTVCCDGPEEEREDLVAYGYFTPSLLRNAHAEAVEEVILPGLEHNGLRSAV
ncbi:MAG TPA: hypothetical protein VF881_03645 [Polyangiaceae bacterium]